MDKYACETGYSYGDPRDILPYEGYYLGEIKDFLGDIYDIYLYSGEPGFILYQLKKRPKGDGNPNPGGYFNPNSPPPVFVPPPTPTPTPV